MKPHQVVILNKILLTASALSLLGAGWIILSFCMFKRLRTFRHQLILGLAISDFLVAFNFLAAAALQLSGEKLSKEKGFCTFNGFMSQTFVIQSDYWIFIIAVCTYFILANYKRTSDWVQNHRLLVWCLPWGFSLLWAIIGLAIAGYSSIGVWCWFPSDRTRLLANFIPRWLIISTIIILYARLYMLIYKAHNHFVSFTNGDPLPPKADNIETASTSSTRPISLSVLTPKGIEGPNATQVIITARNGNGGARPPNAKLKRMAYQMMSYPLAYALIWLFPTIVRMIQGITGSPPPFGVSTIDKTCVAIQGLVDAIIYGFDESLLSVWRDYFSGRWREKGRSEEEGIVVTVHHDVTFELVDADRGRDGRDGSTTWRNGSADDIVMEERSERSVQHAY